MSAAVGGEETPGIAALLAEAAARLAAVSGSPRLDAEVLLAAVLGKPRSFLRAWPERVPAPAEAARFEAWLARRVAGEPVAYITGTREFWSLALVVSPDTLIPRPETELLVELALGRLPADAPLRVADLGTGSGAIALAIATERPRAHVWAVDNSPGALAVASANAARLGLANVECIAGDWCTPLPAALDLIASNPPYIPEADPHPRSGDARFEPRSALLAGPEGLDDIRRIVAQAPAHLSSGGWLLLEHGYDQGEAVPQLLRAAGFVDVECRHDYGGRPRVSLGRWPG